MPTYLHSAFVCLQRSDNNDDFIADLYSNEPTDTSEVAAYLACSDCSLDDLLEFWKRKSSVWPKLSTVAHTMLAVPHPAHLQREHSRLRDEPWRNAEHSFLPTQLTVCCFFTAHLIMTSSRLGVRIFWHYIIAFFCLQFWRFIQESRPYK